MTNYDVRIILPNRSESVGHFSSLWAINHIACNYIENFAEVERVEVVDLHTREVVKTYERD